VSYIYLKYLHICDSQKHVQSVKETGGGVKEAGGGVKEAGGGVKEAGGSVENVFFVVINSVTNM